MKAFCTGCGFSRVPSPSSVVMSAPLAIAAVTTQDRADWPFMMTVQAPHCPSPQPYFGPFCSRSLRRMFSSVVVLPVGPKKVAELRRINVRTIFDLARIGDTDHFRRAALEILMDSDSFRERLATAEDGEVQTTFNCMFTSIADDLHVVRLARVWNAFYKVYQRGQLPDIATRGLLKKPNVVERLVDPASFQPAQQPPRAA